YATSPSPRTTMARPRPPPCCTGCASRSAATAETNDENLMRGLTMRLSTKALGDTALALALAAPAAAWAQDGDTGFGEEIVVTAQKRTQSLIDVPQSVSGLPGATHEQQRGT